MTERELADWHLFTRVQPLPDQLADIHTAMVCSMIANALRGEDDPVVEAAAFFVLRDPRRPGAPAKPAAPPQSEAERFKAMLSER